MTSDREPSASSEDDGFVTAAILLAFYAVCMAASANLYWHGTGKLPWQ
jgi:hypothetical protein